MTNALFMRNWPYAHRLLADPSSPVSGRFGVTALPGPTARDFIRFLAGESSQRRPFQAAGFAPAIAAVYDDPALRQQFPYLDLIRRSGEKSRNRPATPVTQSR